MSDSERSRDRITESDDTMETANRGLVPPREAITGGFSGNADLISYVVAGLLIGMFLDWVLGSAPLMLVVWTLAGFGVGFFRLYQRSAYLDEEGRRRGHGV